MKWLSIAALAWLAAGCATTADRYGSYQYPDEQGYYEVDEVVYGGRAGYSGYYGPGYVAYDPYWGYSGFAYYSNWPSYYVYAPYYDPFYVSSFGFAPVHYYSPYRRYGSVSFFGYYDPFSIPGIPAAITTTSTTATMATMAATTDSTARATSGAATIGTTASARARATRG